MLNIQKSSPVGTKHWIDVNAGDPKHGFAFVAVDVFHEVWGYQPNHGGRKGDEWHQFKGEIKLASTAEAKIIWGIDEENQLWFHKGGAVREEDFTDKWRKIFKDDDVKPPKGEKEKKKLGLEDFTDDEHFTILDVGHNGGVFALTNFGKMYARTGPLYDVAG